MWPCCYCLLTRMRSGIHYLLLLSLLCHLTCAASKRKGKGDAAADDNDQVPLEELISPLDYFDYMDRPEKASKDVKSPVKPKKAFRKKKTKKKTKTKTETKKE